MFIVEGFIIVLTWDWHYLSQKFIQKPLFAFFPSSSVEWGMGTGCFGNVCMSLAEEGVVVIFSVVHCCFFILKLHELGYILAKKWVGPACLIIFLFYQRSGGVLFWCCLYNFGPWRACENIKCGWLLMSYFFVSKDQPNIGQIFLLWGTECIDLFHFYQRKWYVIFWQCLEKYAIIKCGWLLIFIFVVSWEWTYLSPKLKFKGPTWYFFPCLLE